MKQILAILFLALSLGVKAHGQALSVDSTRFISGNSVGTQIAYTIPTSDSGILFVGQMYGNPGGIIPYFPIDTSFLGNVLVGKIDHHQQISWIKVYGGTDMDNATSVCQTPDGGYAVLCFTFSSDGNVTGFKGTSDIWLLKLDTSGNLLWEKTYGSTGADIPLSIANTPDSGFVILGSTNGNDMDVPFHYGSSFTYDWLVIKIDSAGTLQWSKDIGGTREEQSVGAILAIDSNYYLVSSTESTDHDCTDTLWHSGTNTGDDYHILKLDNAGNVIWDSSYGGSQSDVIYTATFDPRDSTIVIIGYTSSNDYMVTDWHGDWDMWVTKMNKKGTLIWQKAIGTLNKEQGTGISTASEGGYVIYGSTHPGAIGEADDWLSILDSNGNDLTDKTFGGTGYEFSTSIIKYKEGYVAAGASSSLTFTEGSCNLNYSGAFISYIDLWPVGVHDIEKPTAGIKTYPNPCNEIVHVALPESIAGNINIIDEMGRIVYSQKADPSEPTIDVKTGSWGSGVYSIIWIGDDGTVMTNKMIHY